MQMMKWQGELQPEHEFRENWEPGLRIAATAANPAVRIRVKLLSGDFDRLIASAAMGASRQ